MVAAAVQLRSASSGGGASALPSAAVIRLEARGKPQATWNRYASVLCQWKTYAARGGDPLPPRRPDALRQLLAEPESTVGARTTPSRSRVRHRRDAALSVLGGESSPVDDPLVRDVRAGLRRTLRGVRGRARPIFSFELPAADSPLPPRPRGSASGPWRLAPGGAVAPPSGSGRGRRRCAARLSSNSPARGSTTYRKVRSGTPSCSPPSPGHGKVLPGRADLWIFGSKTDTAPAGQSQRQGRPGRRPDGRGRRRRRNPP